MKRRSVGFLALLAAAAYAPSAAAQVCAAFPTVDQQFSVAALVGFPDGADQYGVEGSYNLAGPLAVSGGVSVVSPSGGDSYTAFGAGVSYDLLRLTVGASDWLQVCPMVGASYSSSDYGSSLGVPLGLGFGTSINISPTAELMPFAIPQLVMSRYSFDVIDESDTSVDFGLRGGANVGFGQFFVGGELNAVFSDGTHTTFGIRGGLRM